MSQKRDLESYRISIGRLVDPSTKEEWQEAVDSAELMIAIDSCRQYGLIKFYGEINIFKCIQLLERGKSKGYIPVPAIEQLKTLNQ